MTRSITSGPVGAGRSASARRPGEQRNSLIGGQAQWAGDGVSIGDDDSVVLQRHVDQVIGHVTGEATEEGQPEVSAQLLLGDPELCCSVGD